MRPWLLLLAAYVLCLSLAPCRDVGLHQDPEAVASVARTATASDQDPGPCDQAPDGEGQEEQGEEGHGDEGHDDCTPFCACACCGVQVVVTPQHFLPPPPPLMAPATARPTSAATAWNSRPLAAASQPPRV